MANGVRGIRRISKRNVSCLELGHKNFFIATCWKTRLRLTAREYLATRGWEFPPFKHLAWDLPPGWSTLLDQAGRHKLTPQVLEAAGLAIKKDSGHYYDRFRGRIMFPIRDRDARTIAFGGRVLPGGEEGAKYINSPETRLFQKSHQLYGFDLAQLPIRQSKQAIVMEGYTDVMFAHQCGVNNAVAVLGTALGAPHLTLLKRQNCETVVLLLDGDEAGQKRSDAVLELFLHAQLDVRVMTLPDGLDPADYLQTIWCRDLLHALIADAADALGVQTASSERRLRSAGRYAPRQFGRGGDVVAVGQDSAQRVDQQRCLFPPPEPGPAATGATLCNSRRFPA
jgi:DNA primase catalytic core